MGERDWPPTIAALRCVESERLRQNQLWGHEGTCAGSKLWDMEKYAILAEEVGEVARELNALLVHHDEQFNPARLRDELVQVAAIAVAWIEALS